MKLTVFHSKELAVVWITVILCLLPVWGFCANVTLRIYDRTATLLTPADARSLMTNGAAGWTNDALIDPATLQNLVEQPLFNSAGSLVFTIAGSAAPALAVNWPTTRGYSLLILDNLGSGFSTTATINFTYQAALDAKKHLDASLTARPDYVHSSAFQTAYDNAATHIQNAQAAGDEPTRGQEGYLALDDLAMAMDTLLAEYGIAFTQARLGTELPWVGFTLDTVANYNSDLDLAKSIGGVYTWVRIVIDHGTQPSAYTAAVNYAKSIGVKVMLLPIDSQFASGYTRQAYVDRVKLFVDAFPQVDAWEVGNEINGNWLDIGGQSLIPLKVADCAAYVRSTRPGKLVVANLYWQLGTDAPQWSLFNWARANLPPATRADIDVFLFSAYVEDAPLGLAFDKVMRTLQSEFPSHQIGMGEQDYWAVDTSKAWWYIDSADPTTTARRGLAGQSYAAATGYASSVGGVFWWYFSEEMPGDPALQDAVRNVVAVFGVPGAPVLPKSLRIQR